MLMVLRLYEDSLAKIKLYDHGNYLCASCIFVYFLEFNGYVCGGNSYISSIISGFIAFLILYRFRLGCLLLVFAYLSFV